MKQPRPFRIVLALSVISTLFLTSCNISSQKASRSGARKALERSGIETEVVQAALTRQALEPEVAEELLALENHHVDYVLAGNAHLSSEYLEGMVVHSSTDVRSEVAQHPKLSDEQIARLAQDEARVVYCNLARNPDVPKSVLTQLYEDRQPDLIHFAYNPNCPADIRDEILKSGDAKAIQWVKTNDEAREIIQAKAQRLDRIAKARDNR